MQSQSLTLPPALLHLLHPLYLPRDRCNNSSSVAAGKYPADWKQHLMLLEFSSPLHCIARFVARLVWYPTSLDRLAYLGLNLHDSNLRSLALKKSKNFNIQFLYKRMIFAPNLFIHSHLPDTTTRITGNGVFSLQCSDMRRFLFRPLSFHTT
jgi:hypothetical protein